MGWRLGVLTLAVVIVAALVVVRLVAGDSAADGGRYIVLPLDRFAVDSVTEIRLADHQMRCPYGRGFYLVRTEDSVLALSWRDPHSGGVILWSPPEDPGRFHDPRTGTVYLWTGEKMAGPSPRNMDRYPVEMVDGRIRVDTSRIIEGNIRVEPSRSGQENQGLPVTGEGCWAEPTFVNRAGMDPPPGTLRIIKRSMADAQWFPREVEVIAVTPVAEQPASFVRFGVGQRCHSGLVFLSRGRAEEGAYFPYAPCGEPTSLLSERRFTGRLKDGRDYHVMFGFVRGDYPAVEVDWGRLGVERVPVRDGFFVTSRIGEGINVQMDVQDIRVLGADGKPVVDDARLAEVGDGVFLPEGAARWVRLDLNMGEVVLGVERLEDEYLVVYRHPGRCEWGTLRFVWRFGDWQARGGGSFGGFCGEEGETPIRIDGVNTFGVFGRPEIVYGRVTDDQIVRVEAVTADGVLRPARLVEGAFYILLKGDEAAIRALDGTGREVYSTDRLRPGN